MSVFLHNLSEEKDYHGELIVGSVISRTHLLLAGVVWTGLVTATSSIIYPFFQDNIILAKLECSILSWINLKGQNISSEKVIVFHKLRRQLLSMINFMDKLERPLLSWINQKDNIVIARL